MKILKLSQGKYTIVDDADFEWLNQWKWYASKQGKAFYAVRHDIERDGKCLRIPMHRLIMNTPKGMVTDHIDGNTLDNRRVNLRACTNKENVRNRVSLDKRNKSGVTGVSFKKSNGKWVGNIMVDKKQIHLGLFENIEKAIEARREAEIKYFGAFAKK